MNSPCRTHKGTRGYTLIELMVVMVLIGVVLALVGMNFGRALPGVKLKASARELSSTLRYAKSRAQLRAEEVALTIDLDSRRYWIEGKRVVSLPEGTAIVVIDPLSGERSEGRYEVLFYPGGGASGAEIILKGEGRAYSVAVDPLTGSVVNSAEEL